MNELGALIESYRAEHGLSMLALSKRWGIPRQTLAMLVQREVMKDPPREQTLERLAAGLNMDIHELRKRVAKALGYEVVLMQQTGLPHQVAVIMERDLDPEQQRAVLQRALALASERAAQTNELPKRRRKPRTERSA